MYKSLDKKSINVMRINALITGVIIYWLGYKLVNIKNMV